MNPMLNGARIAALAAAFATSGMAFAAESPAGSTGAAVAAGDMVHCYGVHSCQGQADCKTTENECKGQNACNAHGFKAMSASDCLSAEGVIGDLG